MNPKKTSSYARSAALFGKSVAEFWWHFFNARRFPDDQQFYVVYTNLDHGIPFHPDAAHEYWLTNVRFISTAMKLGETRSREHFDEIRQAYVETARQAVAAYRRVPTIMPHFTEHGEQSLHIAQKLLRPINCSPSLHTASPFLGYNLGATYFPEMEPELRRRIGVIISTILRTKLHAVIDVAFGLFLSRKVTRDRLGLDFDDLESFFLQEQKKDKVPYEHIYRIYHAIEELAKVDHRGGDLPAIMERYFQEIGLPRVRREHSNCLYDLEQKALVYPPGLSVGKGLL